MVEFIRLRTLGVVLLNVQITNSHLIKERIWDDIRTDLVLNNFNNSDVVAIALWGY